MLVGSGETDLKWDDEETRSTGRDQQFNSSLEKSLSICFTDIVSLGGNPADGDFDYDGDDNDGGSGNESRGGLNHGKSSPSFDLSLYSHGADNRRSKSVSNLRDLDNELKVKTSKQFNKWRDDTINCGPPQRTCYRVTFEIISAQTVASPVTISGPRSKYVSYTITIKRCPGLDTQPVVIERRYSEFAGLYKGLVKRFPGLLTDFEFPKKTLVSNFSSQVIRERSIAFQNLLTYCLSIDELRTSRQFLDFLHAKEMLEVRKLIKMGNFEDAGNILENNYFIQEKIALHSSQPNAQVFQILVLLVGCMNAANSQGEAFKYAEKAVELLLHHDYYDRNELTVPFILLTMELFDSMGKSKDALERKLAKMKEKGIKKIDKQPTLIEMIVKKDCTNISSLRFF